MRPIPRRRHLLAILIFAVVSASVGYLAMIDDNLSKTQMNIASVAVKRQQPDLFTHDSILGDSGRWRFDAPFFQAQLEMVLVPTGYQDLTLPFRAMAGVAVMVYLCGIYSLLYRQCRSWSISAFVAILSSAIVHTLGPFFWGVGSLGSIMPSALVVAVIPLIVLAYLRYEDQWRLLLVFAFVGLVGNVHLASSINLGVVLLIVYLGRHRFAPSAWLVAMACAACLIVASIPYASYYLHLRYGMVPPEARIQADVLHRAFRLGRLAVLYPDLFKSLLLWLLLVMVLIVPAAAVLPRVERFRVRDLSMWLWLAGGASFVALGLHGLSQLVGTLRHQAPPIVDFAQASSLVMLPLYVLFAQALTNLFRLVRTHRALLRWACAAFMAGWMLPSDNLQAARHMVYRWASALMEADQQPLRFQEITVKRAKDAELAEIAFWARHNTDKDAVFLTGSVEFRMLSRRAIVVSQDDVKYFYYVTPWELEEWIWRMARQSEVLSPPAGEASEQAISQFVDELKNRGYREVAGWYVILPAEAAPDAPGALEPITAQGWGQHYRLYRVG